MLDEELAGIPDVDVPLPIHPNGEFPCADAAVARNGDLPVPSRQPPEREHARREARVVLRVEDDDPRVPYRRRSRKVEKRVGAGHAETPGTTPKASDADRPAERGVTPPLEGGPRGPTPPDDALTRRDERAPRLHDEVAHAVGLVSEA